MATDSPPSSSDNLTTHYILNVSLDRRYTSVTTIRTLELSVSMIQSSRVSRSFSTKIALALS